MPEELEIEGQRNPRRANPLLEAAGACVLAFCGGYAIFYAITSVLIRIQT